MPDAVILAGAANTTPGNVIDGGALILSCIMKRFGFSEVLVSDHDVRLLLDLLDAQIRQIREQQVQAAGFLAYQANAA